MQVNAAAPAITSTQKANIFTAFICASSSDVCPYLFIDLVFVWFANIRILSKQTPSFFLSLRQSTRESEGVGT